MSANAPIEMDDFGDYLQAVVVEMESGDMSKPLRDCAPVVRQSIRDNFNSSADPENNDWVERKYVGDGHPLLIDTGKMMQAATGGGPGAVFRTGQRDLELGIDLDIVPYARRHNYGDQDDGMPKREFIGAKEEHLVECETIIADHAEQFFTR